MVRSLAIRQTFILLDVSLALLVVAAAGLIVFELFQPPQAIASLENSSGLTDVDVIRLPEVLTKNVYLDIVGARLFGEAGTKKVDPNEPPPPPPPVNPDVEDTKLNLALVGVLHAGDKSPFSSAAIQNRDQRGAASQAFWIGDLIVDRVTLEDIRKREVIILNKRMDPNGKLERISMDDEDQKNIAAAPSPAVDINRSSRITLSKQDLIDELTTGYADLLKVQPRLERDSSGRVIGITADGISKQPLAQKLGLEDGDVLQTINNERVDSQEKILELVNKYRNANSFRLAVKRADGRTRTITYSLR